MKDQKGMIFLICIGILLICTALWLGAYVMTHPPIADPLPPMWPSH